MGKCFEGLAISICFSKFGIDSVQWCRIDQKIETHPYQCFFVLHHSITFLECSLVSGLEVRRNRLASQPSFIFTKNLLHTCIRGWGGGSTLKSLVYRPKSGSRQTFLYFFRLFCTFLYFFRLSNSKNLVRLFCTFLDFFRLFCTFLYFCRLFCTFLDFFRLFQTFLYFFVLFQTFQL